MEILDMIITQPFSWILLQLYMLTQSFGFAIILFSLVAKGITIPFSMKGKRGMLDMQRLQPKLNAIQKKYANNREKYNAEVQKLYETEEVKPMSGCLWSIIPFPIMIGLYAVIRNPLTNLLQLTAEQVTKISEFVQTLGITVAENDAYRELVLAKYIHPNYDAISSLIGKPDLLNINFTFFGINLCDTPTFALNALVLIPLISALASLVSMMLTTRMTARLTGAESPAANSIVNYLMMPGMSLWFGFIMPAAMGVYWIAQSVFSMLQEILLTRHYRGVFAKEAEERARKEARKKARLEAEKTEKQRRREEAMQAKTKGKKFKVNKNISALKPVDKSDEEE